jgi:Fic family protein
MGRFWQTMLLSRWKGIFAWLPVETIVKEHQQDYYNVIAKCDAAGNSTAFVEFMLKCLLDAMENYEDTEEETVELHDKLHDKLHDMFPELSEKAFGVLEVLKAHPGLKAEDIGVQVSLSERQVKTYINALKQAGLIVRVGSNKTGYWKVTIEE